MADLLLAFVGLCLNPTDRFGAESSGPRMSLMGRVSVLGRRRR